MWRLGKRELIAMVVGSIIYGLVLYAMLSWAASIDRSADGAISWFLFYGINNFSPLDAAIIAGSTFALPFFIGAEFGPWTGLVCAIIGRFLAELLFSLQPYPPSPLWTEKGLYIVVYTAWALFGLLPGLANGLRKRLYAKVADRAGTGSFIAVSILTSIGSLLAADLLLYLVERNFSYSAIGHQDFLTPLWSYAAGTVFFSSLIGLIILALLLVLTEYGPISRSSRSTHA